MWTCTPPTPELVTPAATEPVTLAELKTHMSVDFDDDDTPIAAFGVAARQWFETAIDRQLVTATWKIRLQSFGGWEVELPYPPLRSIGSIVYVDGSLVSRTLSSATYDVLTWRTPGVVRPKSGYAWPSTGLAADAVVITFDAGYGAAAAVPELVKSGIKLLAAHWYENREASTEATLMTVPMAVDSIVAAVRAYRF